MTNGADSIDINKTPAEMFVYFSEVLKKDVKDSKGVTVGVVYDISAKTGDVYPRSGDLVIKRGFFNRSYTSVPWSKVASIGEDLVIVSSESELKFDAIPRDYELLFRRDILDQQVVDTYNHKVKRVNDIHLLRVDHELIVAHVDIGLRGLFRRLGWEKTMDAVTKLFIGEEGRYRNDDLVSWKFIQPVSINPASMTIKLSVSEKQLSGIPPADLGDMMFDLNPKQRMALFGTLDVKTKARVFEHIEPEEQKAMLKELDKKEAALIVTHMSSDEATDLLERLPRNTVRNLLALIESGRAKKLSALLGYSSDSAGGLMTTEFVSLPETMSIGEAIDHIKNKTSEVETAPYIYIVDEKNRLKGITTVRRLLFAESKESISKTSFGKTMYVYLNNGVKEIAYFMDKYKLSAIPVIDKNKVLQGIVTVDDILSQVISIAWRKRPSAAPNI